MDPRDTICALSTAPGRSGIAVVRLSGAGCLELLRGAFRPERPVDSWPARRAMLGRLVDARSGEEIDEAIVTRGARCPSA